MDPGLGVILLIIGAIGLVLYYTVTPEQFVRVLAIIFLVVGAVILLLGVLDVNLEGDADAALAGTAAVCRWRMP